MENGTLDEEPPVRVLQPSRCWKPLGRGVSLSLVLTL